MKKRRIGIFTGNRAEYGMQYPILKVLTNDKRFECYLIVSGAHIDEKFGNTIKEIEDDGFRIFSTIDMTVAGDSLFDTTQAIGKGILNLSEILKELKPDIFLVYADRFESFAAMIASTQMAIPTAHIEGGDITEGGALDDMVRHSMSKLAHLHFTTNEDASQRLCKMGEESWRVHTVGFPGIDLINDRLYASPSEIYEKFNIDIKKPVVIYTQHSIATEFEHVLVQIEPALKAMIKLAEENVQCILTFPNNDAGSLHILNRLNEVIVNKRNNIQVYKSLGRYFYHGFLSLCGRGGLGVCVGNSSSGIKETPAFGCPVVNIGDRQKGRLRGENVIDVDYEEDAIYNAVKKALYDVGFREHCRLSRNPYGTGGVGKKIADVLANTRIDSKLIQKKMTY